MYFKFMAGAALKQESIGTHSEQMERISVFIEQYK